MQQAGVEADVSREDTDESVVHRIVIPKHSRAADCEERCALPSKAMI